MAYVILPSRRKRPDVFELDHSHDLAQGLVFAGMSGLADKLYSFTKSKKTSLVNTACSKWIFDAEIQRRSLWQYPVVSQNPSINIGPLSIQTGPSTVSFWSKHSGSIDTSGFVIFGQQATSVYWQHFADTQFIVQAATVYIPSTPRQSSVWRFWALTSNGNTSGTKSVYLNGSLLGSVTGVSNAPTVGDNWTYAGWSSQTQWRHNGYLSDIIVHNRILSVEEIKALANKTDPMLAGLIRDKKLPNTKLWHGADLPNDYKVKTVAPVIINPTQLKKERGARLNYDHWSTQDIVSAYMINEQSGKQTVDLVTGKRTTPFNGTNYQRTHSGLYFTQGSTNLNANKRILNPPINNWTLLVRANLIQADDLEPQFVVGHDNNNACLSLRAGIGLYWYNSGYVTIYVEANVFGDKTWVLVRKGNTAYWYANGRIIGTSDCTGLVNSWGDFYSLGCSWGNANSRLELMSVIGWHRSFTPQEAKSISANPNQVLAPQKRTIYAFHSKFDIVGQQGVTVPVKTVTPVVLRQTKPKRPDMFELDHSHDLAKGLVYFLDMPSISKVNGAKLRDVSKYKKSPTTVLSSAGDVRFYNTGFGRNAVSLLAASTQYVELPSSLDFTTGEFSFGFWVVPYTTINSFAISSRAASNLAGWEFGAGLGSVPGACAFRVGRTTSVNGASLTLPTDGRWSHVWCNVVTVSTYRWMDSYLNGQFIGRLGSISGDVANSQNFCLGKRGGTYGNFEIADVTFYNRPLSQTEIKVLANKTDPMLGGLIRGAKSTTIYSVGSYIDNGAGITWNWGNKS